MDALRDGLPVHSGLACGIRHIYRPMNVQSVILLVIVLALAVWVLRFHLKKRKETGGCGACNGCSGCPSGHTHCLKSHHARK